MIVGITYLHDILIEHQNCTHARLTMIAIGNFMPEFHYLTLLFQ